jgi:Holliday junction resolvase
MTHRKRTDKNQKSIVEALRKIGCIVKVLSDSGGGIPDLLIGVEYVTILMEVKTKDNWYGKKGLSETQSEFLMEWKGGLVLIAYDAEDAINKVQNEITQVRNFKRALEDGYAKGQIKNHIFSN